MKTIIGLTGTTGAGKSTVSKQFSDCGFYVINCDKVAKNVVENDVSILTKLCNQFGDDIISNGLLNRSLLASRAFANKQSTEALNNITLPAIVDKIKQLIDTSKSDYIILDAPTLFESGANKLCNTIIGVISDDDLRIKRIINRDNITTDAAQSRMSAQNSNEFFKQNCTYIIENNTDLESLYDQTKSVINSIKEG